MTNPKMADTGDAINCVARLEFMLASALEVENLLLGFHTSTSSTYISQFANGM